MIEMLKTFILDFQDELLPNLPRITGVPRRARIVSLKGKATIWIGVRRCGKSTLLFQIMQQLLESGVPRQNILYLNFFDDRLHHLQDTGLSIIVDAYYSLYPEKKNAERVYCFFDEIQIVSHWEPFVDRLLRTETCSVYITGSSAQMLSREIATQMRGRSLSLELFPFSFPEYLDSQNISHTEPLTTRQQHRIQHAFVTYWKTGGFPEVLGLDRWLRIRIHQEYFHAILFRDLVERHNIRHPRGVMDLARHLVDNIASLYSINRLTGHLQARGHKVPKSSVSDYLNWFEDAYFLYTVRLFHVSLNKANANPKKIYGVDHALMSSLGSGILVKDGHLLENLVFARLRRATTQISYFKSQRGREVDFVVQLQDGAWQLIQVSETLVAPRTRAREIASLRDAMSELSLSSGTIVTRNEEDWIDVPEGLIKVLPAWRFLLSLPDTAEIAHLY